LFFVLKIANFAVEWWLVMNFVSISKNMDQLDAGIIRELQDDARKPFTEIAKTIGVTEGTVRNRVSRLLSDETLRLRGTVDPHKAGFKAPAFIQISVQPGLLDQVAEQLATVNEVSYIVATTGDHDLLVEILCRDPNHLMSLISDKIHKVAGITNTSTSMILRIYKELMPNLGDYDKNGQANSDK
jgi:Lrp/AsnC family transcriptional regulator for asnA, asnC and gidA